MFYSQDILQKRGGKFGIIWIAATEAVKLTRRDYCKVNIIRTCEDIIQYILVQVQATPPSKTRPRFSLYLSTQLMYGVIKVYTKQQDFLIEDLTQLHRRSDDLTSTLNIDLPVHKGEFDMVQDIDAFVDQNLEFGVLDAIEKPLIGADTVPDLDFWVTGVPLSPDRTQVADIELPTKSPEVQRSPFQPEIGSPHQAASRDITLRDVTLSPVEKIQIPDEQDLPKLQDLDELMAEISTMATISTEMEAAPADITTKLPEVEEVQLPPAVTEQLDDAVLLPTEETPLVRPTSDLQIRKRLPSPGVTPVSPRKRQKVQEKSFELELDISPVVPGIRRRKRRLVFSDSVTQLSKMTMKYNQAHSRETCKEPEVARLFIPDVTNLLIEPCKKAHFKHHRLMRLWKRNLLTVALTKEEAADLSREWADHESDEATSVESAEKEALVKAPELSPVPEEPRGLADESVEVAREMSSLGSSRLHLSASTPHHSVLSEELGSAKQALSFSDTSARGSFMTPGEDVSILPSMEIIEEQVMETELPVVPEEVEAMISPPPVTPAKPVTVRAASPCLKYLTGRVRHLTHGNRTTTFAAVCPHDTTSRSTASRVFSRLLDLAALRKVEVYQEYPYGDIYINRRHVA